MSLPSISDADYRAHIRCRKAAGKAATDWSVRDIPPKISPYKHSRPAGRGVEWRAVTAMHEKDIYHVLVIANPRRSNYQAFLTLQSASDRYMIARLETHPSHPGIHFHTWCEETEVPRCPFSIDAPFRLPSVKNVSRHRASAVFTPQSFWVAACTTFNVVFPPNQQLSLL